MKIMLIHDFMTFRRVCKSFFLNTIHFFVKKISILLNRRINKHNKNYVDS